MIRLKVSRERVVNRKMMKGYERQKAGESKQLTIICRKKESQKIMYQKKR
jgi:hypothetical protein